MKKTLIIAAALLIGTSVGAQEIETSTEIKAMPVRAEVRADIRANAPLRAEVRGFATGTKEMMQKEIEARKQEIEMRKGEIEVRKDVRASTTAARMEDKKVRVEDRMEARASSTEARMEKRASSTAARAEEKKEKIEDRLAKSVENLSEKSTKIVERLKEIKAKIEARISKMEAEGSDMSVARGNLVTAEAKIAAAGVAVEAIASITVDASNPKASLEALKKAGSEANIAIRAAHESLNATVQSMK